MTTETWKERFARSWNDPEREGYFDRRTTKREIEGFIRREIQQERERILEELIKAKHNHPHPYEDESREKAFISGMLYLIDSYPTIPPKQN